MKKNAEKLTGTRWIAILLILSVMVSALPALSISALAADGPSGTCGDGLKWSFDTSTGKLTIRGSGAMDDYAYDPSADPGGRMAPWYDYLESIRTVDLPDGLTHIGDYAFCRSLITEIMVPESVTSIGSYAFEECESLQSINVEPENSAFCSEAGGLFSKDKTELIRYPEGKSGSYAIWAEEIKLGEHAFRNCSGLTGLDIMGGLRQIGEKQFADCRNLRRVSIYGDMESIGALAFADCVSLENIEILSHKTEIGAEAFLGCSSLTEVVLPTDLKNMSTGLFKGCTSLKKMTIPSSVTTVGSSAFSGCTALERVGIEFGVQGIESRAFENCSSLKKIEIPGTISTIGAGVFEGCSSLTDVTIYDGVTGIGESAFEGCTNLRNVVVPKSVKEIGPRAFTGCVSMDYLAVMNETCRISFSELPAGTEIRGSSGSAAEAYAKENGHVFGALSRAGFADVPEKAFYGDPAAWAVENGITNGTEPYTFSPDQTCTRDQVVTFLWRAAGEPEPKSTQTPFTDLQPGAFYEKAVAWAVEEGITKGQTDTTFGPDATCTRGQVVTFLWRFKGQPAPKSTQTPFTDVNPNGYYMKAVAWAVEEGVTKGLSETTFGPDATCTRGQVVTFLYRATAE